MSAWSSRPRGANRADLSIPEDEEEGDDEEDEEPADINETVRAELEGLAADLEAAEIDISEVLETEEATNVENAAAELSMVPEALATLRNAREKV